MATTNIAMRIDKDLTKEAEELFMVRTGSHSDLFR